MNGPTDLFEPLLQKASDGDTAAARAFYEAFLREQLTVPRRHQTYPLSNAPQYPSEFLDVLGVASEDGVTTVPVFSSARLVPEWAGNDLLVRTIVGAELLKLIPEGWWITFNPGSDWGKEFSSWEISQLLLGENAIDEVVRECFEGEIDDQAILEPLSLEIPSESHHQKLRQALEGAGAEHREIQKIWLLHHRAEGTAERLVLGILLRDAAASETSKIQGMFEKLCAPYVIGAESLRVYVGAGDDGLPLNLGQFEPFPPCFEQKQTPYFLTKLLNFRLFSSSKP
ncbi:MAG: SseB family protein [Bdellovibrionales bacterium]|nr:SseB family protein [Bdellovibrionales bacterium]